MKDCPKFSIIQYKSAIQKFSFLNFPVIRKKAHFRASKQSSTRFGEQELHFIVHNTKKHDKFIKATFLWEMMGCRSSLSHHFSGWQNNHQVSKRLSNRSLLPAASTSTLPCLTIHKNFYIFEESRITTHALLRAKIEWH